jgi:hypothetical protein
MLTFVAEPLTVLAVAISTSQPEVGLPWIIGTTVLCGACWALIAVDMRRRPVARAADPLTGLHGRAALPTHRQGTEPNSCAHDS